MAKSTTVTAKSINKGLISRLDKRASPNGSVLGPCLRRYKLQVGESPEQPDVYLRNLTQPLLDAFEETQQSIVARFKLKWSDDVDMVNRSVANSLRRSAGTNYQALVSYALASYLVATDSQWYIVHPVPKEFRKALAITFTAGIPIEPQEIVEPSVDDGDESEPESAAYTIQPDVDVLLRNAGYVASMPLPEPVVLLSVKTSLVDRAGMAARWKTYFDQATHPCALQDREECVYRRLGITMENHDKYEIQHGIVTANIYKINFHDERYKVGELASGQTRSNTYMFDVKLSTRDDGIAVTPDDWSHFPEIVQVLSRLSRKYGLPT